MEKCETCISWNVLVSNMEKFDSPKANTYGKCGKPIEVTDGTSTHNRFPALVDRGVAVFLDSADGATLYTKKDHCCKCWEAK